MDLNVTLTHLEKDIARHVRAYAEGRERHVALGPYETARAALGALAKSSALDFPARNAVVLALVKEHQGRPGALWQSMLTCAFAPLLVRLRKRIGPPRELDLDQRVLVAFLEAIRRVDAGDYTLLAIRRATEAALFPSVRADREEPDQAVFDDVTYTRNAFEAAPFDMVAAAEILRLIEARGEHELLDVVLATCANDESLADYVARTHPGADEAARASAYDRLWLARSHVVTQLRARLAA